MDIRALAARTYRITGILPFVLHLLGVAMVSCACPSSWSSVAERCLHDHIPSHPGDTAIGSYEHWVVSCRQHNDSLGCLDRRVEDCRVSGGDVSGAASIRIRIHQDYNNMCGNNDTYERFQRHSACFERVSNQTVNCQEAYTKDVVYEYIFEDHYQYEYTQDEYADNHTHLEKICGAVRALLTCINRVVRNLCGEDAVELYDQMVISQIPSHVTDTCPEITSTAPRLSRTTTLVSSFIVTILGLT